MSICCNSRLSVSLKSMKNWRVSGTSGGVDKERAPIHRGRIVLVMPEAVDRLGLGRDGTETAFKLQEQVRDKAVGDRKPVIEPKRQQELEATQGFAHKWPDLRR